MGATAEVDTINIVAHKGASLSDLCTESCPVLDCLRRQLRGM